MAKVAYTAKSLLELLEVRHSQDIFVSECKNGPTQGMPAGTLLKMDAWTMRRSWTNPDIHAYEIKVSRSDFMQDDKWPRYLKYCHRFSFVCPPGLIDKGELPPEVGLVVCTKNQTKLITKRKAAPRNVTIPNELFMYILMARSRINKERYAQDDNLDYWRNWLAEKEESQEVGHRVACRLREKYSEDVRKVQCDQLRLESEVEELKHVATLCEELGLRPNKWMSKEQIQDRANDSEAIGTHHRQLAARVASEANRLVESLGEAE